MVQVARKETNGFQLAPSTLALLSTKNLDHSPPPLPCCLDDDSQQNGRKLFQYIQFATQTFLLLQISFLRFYNADLKIWSEVVFPSFSSRILCHRKLSSYALALCLFLCLAPIMKPLSLAFLTWVLIVLYWEFDRVKFEEFDSDFFLIIFLKHLIYPPLLSYVPL